MKNNEERAHVYISGNVQGVFFRDSTRRKAEELGIAGWVKNTPEGRVEAVFEGPSSVVQEMIEWCKEGSSPATVEEVDTEREEPAEDLEGFEIR